MKQLSVKLSTFILVFFLPFALFAQQPIVDSLQLAFKKSEQDTCKANILLELGNQFKDNSLDTALHFYKEAWELAESVLKRPDVSEEEKFAMNFLKGCVMRYEGVLYTKMGDFENAIANYEKAIEIYTSLLSNQNSGKKLYTGLTKTYDNVGITYAMLGKFPEAIHYFSKSLSLFKDLSERSDDQLQIFGRKGMAQSHVKLGVVYWNLGDFDSATINYSHSLTIYEDLGDQQGVFTSLNNIGNVHSYKGDYAKAIDSYLKALKIAEELNNSREIFQCYNNIGLIHEKQKNNEQAMSYFDKALKIAKENKDKRGISLSYGNIGQVLHEEKQFNAAIENYLKALEIEEELGDINRLAALYSNLGNTYKDINDYKKTEEYYRKTLEIDLETGNKNGIANSYSNLAILKNQIADSLKGSLAKKRQHLREAIQYAKKSLEIAKEIEAYPIINDASKALMLANKKLGNASEAFKYAEIYISSRDTMFSAEKTSAIANAEKMFEAEKKQLQIDKLNKERQLQQAQIKQQRYINWSVIVGIIMITIFSIIIVGRLRITRKQKRIIENQKEEVDNKNALLEQQNEEIKTQNEIVTKQKERIEEQQQKIADSINYALKIQKAVLPSNQYAQKVLNNHFILFMPHSTVSGDFYWMTRIGEWSIVAVADCTGHGVPGAFMSMLGVSFLNEIVRKNEIVQPAEILNELRKYVISALKQTASNNESLIENELYGGQLKDGMDISVLAINKEENKAMWAGAYNPLWIIRNSKKGNLHGDIDDIVEYKADKMPVAIHVIMNPFTNHEFELHKGDKLYMFSDGFPDQFGGSNAKKFMRKRFKKLIAESAHLCMEDQGGKLQMVFNEWINNNGDPHDQVDDVTVLGIEV